jgi:hypothetical protein
MRNRLAVGLSPALVLLLIAADVVVAEDKPVDEASGPPVTAVWNEKEIYLTYTAFTTYYSCDGLRDKVRRILKDLGARPDLKVTTAGCTKVSGPELMPRVRIRAAMPVVATPERIAALAKEAPKKELIARVNKGRTDAYDATQQFGARPKTIEIKDSVRGPIEAGDCELMEQLSDRVLVPLGIRVLEEDIRCTPHQVNYGSIRLKVEVLEPIKPEELVAPPPGE